MCEDTTGHSCLAIRYFQEENPATSPPRHLDPPVSCHLATSPPGSTSFSKLQGTNVARAPPKGLPTLSLLRILCVYLNQINFTGRLNFGRRHREVWISICTKERGFQKRIRRPLRGDFRLCEYTEKLWRENQTRHEGFKLPNKRRQYGAIQQNYVNVFR